MVFNKSIYLAEREHESHIQKRESSYLPKDTYRVTKVNIQGEKAAEILSTNGKFPLVEGTVIGLNDLILTHNCLVEIRDNNGLIFRLGEHPEFSLELTVIGIAPIFFGSVFKTRFSGYPPTMCAGKYRTSCYLKCPTTLHTENVEDGLDVFYSLSEETEIWEYDEKGKKFPIINVEEGYKVYLRYISNRPMRERYNIEKIQPISHQEYDYIAMNYMNPKYWI